MNESLNKIIDMADKAAAEENVSLLKEAVAAACEYCKTWIESDVSSGREIIRPVIISDEERTACVSVYDRCTTLIKEKDRFYIPDQIERNRPERARLLFLVRQFLAERSAVSMKEQQTGTSFNRLFGSRG